MADAHNITKVVADHAKHLFKMTNDANIFRGKSQETVIAGCIFIACRHCKVPRTFREMFNMTNVSKKEIGRIYKQLAKFFQDMNERDGQQSLSKFFILLTLADLLPTAMTPAAELCIRYCNQLQLGPQVVKVSQAIAEKMGTVEGLAGRSPLSAAAACIYFASALMRDPRTAKEIAGVVGVSDGTIRTSYKFLEGEKQRLVQKEWLQDGKGDMSLLPKP